MNWRCRLRSWHRTAEAAAAPTATQAPRLSAALRGGPYRICPQCGDPVMDLAAHWSVCPEERCLNSCGCDGRRAAAECRGPYPPDSPTDGCDRCRS